MSPGDRPESITPGDRKAIVASARLPLTLGAKLLGPDGGSVALRANLVRSVTANQALLRLGSRLNTNFVVSAATDSLLPEVGAVLDEVISGLKEPSSPGRTGGARTRFQERMVEADVRKGQVWEDNDPRRPGRRVRILETPPAYSAASVKVQAITLNGEGAGRRVFIRLDRLGKRGTKGYTKK